jgi:hypothetical protein
MHIKPILIAALVAMTLPTTALAQQPSVKDQSYVTSVPGKATAVRNVEMSAQVLAVDKATRAVTIKGPKGDVVPVTAGSEVRNFDQIKVSDLVVVRYAETLTLKLRKPGAAGNGDVAVRQEMRTAKPGEAAVGGSRQLALIAEVTALDRTKSTITLKTPQGDEVTLDVRNPDQFNVVKTGDKIDVTYTEDLALSVEPAAEAPQAKN